MCRSIMLAFVVLLYAPGVMAQQISQKQDSVQAGIPKPVQVVTHHAITVGGRQILYTATTGTLLLKNEKDSVVALFGFTAYTKDGVAAGDGRPITFAYNGGPGSSSIWLHMGALGPRRVVIDDPKVPPPPPYKLEDNQYSLLDVTDLVMVDPVGTGLSRPVAKAKASDFWGVDQDIKSVSRFIFQYISENNRWNSPKFLIGESYGTMRSAGVADYLFENLGITVNGIVLVSSILNFQGYNFTAGNDLPHVLYLPTYTAVAWYHHALPKQTSNLDSLLIEAKKFAAGEYSDALFKGSGIDSTEYNDVVGKLHEYTGISESYWKKANLRLSDVQFTQELLRGRGETVGVLDSRYRSPTRDLLGEYADYDPQSTAISPVFITDFLNYFRTELNFPADQNYSIGAYSDKDFKWDWKPEEAGMWWMGYYDVTGKLVDVMQKNPYLNVLVLNGYFDLATPFFGTEYTMEHLGNNIPGVKERIRMKYFNAGHMMYIHSESLPLFKSAVAEFIEEMSQPKKK